MNLMSTVSCSVCKTSVDENRCHMDEDGPVCESCFADNELKTAYRKGTAQYAVGAMGAACVAFVFNPKFLVSLLALGSAGLFVKEFMTKDPLHKKAVAEVGIGHKLLAVLAACLAIGQLVARSSLVI